MKVILHLDFDSYFASAARTVDSTLIGKPIVISSGGDRAIIAAASYEAKKLGAKVPEPLYLVKQKVPNVVVVKPDYGLYTYLSSQVFEYIITNYTKNVEVASIDECYIDATDLWQKYGSPFKTAKFIQEDILKKFKLPCSFGISTNKFVAKMSTDINKPFGITVIQAEDFLKVFAEKDIIKFFGIGKATKAKLNRVGIKTIGDLAKANVIDLKPVLGLLAASFIAQANGKGSDKLNLEHNELKGIGNEITFQHGDKTDRNDILKTFEVLTEMVAQRLKNRNFAGKVISVYYKKTGGIEEKRIMKQRTFERYIFKYEELLAEVIRLFDEIWTETSIKFVGLRVTSLIDIYEATYQRSIFEKLEQKTATQNIIDKVNKKFKQKAVVTGDEFVNTQNKKLKQQKFIESDRIIKHFDVKK